MQSNFSSTLIGAASVALGIALALPLVAAAVFFGLGIAGRAFQWMCGGF